MIFSDILFDWLLMIFRTIMKLVFTKCEEAGLKSIIFYFISVPTVVAFLQDIESPYEVCASFKIIFYNLYFA